MILSATIILTSISLYFYLRAFNQLEDKNNFLLSVFLGFTLTLTPIFSVQNYLKEYFDIFQVNYRLNDWTGFWHQFTNVFLYVGVLEELTKLLIALIILFYVRRKKFFTATKKEKAILVFLILAGISLGFAFIENLVYALNYKDLQIILLRSLISTIIHVLCGVEMGFGLALLILNRSGFKKLQWLIYSILVPILIHTFYDTGIKYLADSSMIIYFLIIVTLISYELVGTRISMMKNILGKK